jgi:cytoskeletal protein RodZ
MPISDRDRRMVRIGGIVVGVLVVGFLLLKLLGGGGAEEPFPSSSPLKPSSSSIQPTGTPSLAPSPVLVLPARDPFSIPPGFESTTSSSGGSTTTSSSGGSSTSSSSGGSTTTGTTTPPTQPGNGASKTVGGHTVVLLDTFTANGVEQAQVEVDGTVYDPSVGQTFGPNKQYRLQSVSGNCATFLYGDESFTLCVSPNK